METVGAFATLVLAFVNMGIYHKIFRVYYFGSLQKSLFKEFLGALIIAAFEVALVVHFGGIILQVIFGIIVVVAVIVMIIFGIVGIHKRRDAIKGCFSSTFSKVQRKNEKKNEKYEKHKEEKAGNENINHREVKAQAVEEVVTKSNKENSIPVIEKRELYSKPTQNEIKSVHCTACGNMISVHAKFCSKCGAENWYLKNVINTKKLVEIKCISCGKCLAFGTKFCTECGKAVEIKEDTNGGLENE